MDDTAKLICCSLDEHWIGPTYENSLHRSTSIMNLTSGYVSHPQTSYTSSFFKIRFVPPHVLLNFRVYKEGSRKIVDSGWNVRIEGYAMYRVAKRLKGLKSPFSKLLHDHEAHLDEERFLQQKAKVEWLKAGDSNTSYFHKIVKSKYTRNMIEMVSDSFNTFYDGNQVPGAFVKHYNQFLRGKGVSNPLDNHDIFTRVLDISKANCMVSGLVPSIPKSTSYFCNVPSAIKPSILNSMPFAEGEMKKGKAKVTWDSICMPKHEGGLGIHRIEDLNIALMATHIWSILTHRESLWVKWVYTYKLKGRSFFDVPCRDFLSNRDIVRLGFSLDESGKMVVSILSRIVVAATSYYIWLERNGRLFKKKTLTPDQIVDVILVRLKLVTFKFKKMSTKSRLLLDQWKIPIYCIVHGGSTR
nr:RNA-directed DNA polymerase, eukaryota, reverse transcriptase zinc-binding domain protein [Tanacetum cinerariifolium]